jgi:hypothetical protein
MRVLVIISIFFISIEYLYADVPQCAKFQLIIETKDSKIIEGYYYYYGLYSFEIFNYNHDSISFRRILEQAKRTNYPNKIKVFKNIIKLKNIKCFQYNYFACLNKDVIDINISDISSFKQIGIYTCHPEDSLNNNYPSGCPPEVITELTEKEINLLNKEPNLTFRLDNIDYFNEDLCIPVIVSYNPNMTKENIINLVKELINKEQPSNMDNVYKNLKNKLSIKKVIIFKTFYYN